MINFVSKTILNYLNQSAFDPKKFNFLESPEK